VLAIIVAAVALSSCNSPTDSRGREPNEPPTAPITLEISAPESLVVHGWELVNVTAKNQRGEVVRLSAPARWWSSDSSVASVSDSGVVYATQRGTAMIYVNAGGATATVSLRVVALVRLTAEPFLGRVTYWPMAIGDTLRFRATMLDVNGVPIGEFPSATWMSGNPDAVSVSDAGEAVARQPNTVATITASTADGPATADIHVTDGFPGVLATVRFAHAALGVGPVTFRFLSNLGAPITLSFGESIERQIPAGEFLVQTSGLPSGDPTYYAYWSRAEELLRPGDHLSLYVVGDATQAFLTPAWDNTPSGSVPSDSGLVRLVQGWSPFGVVYLRATGAPISGLPELCYFDPAEVSEYFRLGAGPFDLILQTKYGPKAAARIAAEAQAGHAVTLVLIGNDAKTAGVLAFRDP